MSDDLDLAGLTRPGDLIAWSGASGEPTRLLEMLNDCLDRVEARAFFTNVGVSAAIEAPRVAARGIRVRAVGGAGTNRRFAEAGLLDVMPGHYSSLCDMVVDGFLPIDVALVQLATDGVALYQSPAVDYIADALPRARVVVAEVNEQAPVVEGDTRVSFADVDHIVRTSRSVVEVGGQAGSDVAKTIGQHVARLVPDGATLQTGIGSLPDAVLECLVARRDLGLHSGTIGDRAADLVEMGVINNRKKPIDTGLSVTAGLLGMRRAYAWAHRNPGLRLRSPRYTHDTATHALIPNLFGINSALEVDLTGQVNAEVAGDRHIGMVGGHGDFMRGCMRSRGGRGIVALESTARAGKMSRIVPRLSAGVVTTSRSDADVIVTEYGIAELRGRTLAERARALIAIAHPDFRRDLETAAERLV
jgi:acyl-CoA hydrolase